VSHAQLQDHRCSRQRQQRGVVPSQLGLEWLRPLCRDTLGVPSTVPAALPLVQVVHPSKTDGTPPSSGLVFPWIPRHHQHNTGAPGIRLNNTRLGQACEAFVVRSGVKSQFPILSVSLAGRHLLGPAWQPADLGSQSRATRMAWERPMSTTTFDNHGQTTIFHNHRLTVSGPSHERYKEISSFGPTRLLSPVKPMPNSNVRRPQNKPTLEWIRGVTVCSSARWALVMGGWT